MNRLALIVLITVITLSVQSTYGKSTQQFDSTTYDPLMVPMTGEDYILSHGTHWDYEQHHGMDEAMFELVDETIKLYKVKLGELAGLEILPEDMDDFIADALFNEEQLNSLMKEIEDGVMQYDGTGNTTGEEIDFEIRPTLKWNSSEPIPYIFSGNQTVGDLQGIHGAIDLIEDMTCLRFEEFPSDANLTRSHILFVNYPQRPCYSWVGRQTQVIPQPLNLWSNWCTGNLGVILHEIAHALGLWHEQSRYDRLDYIDIHWERILSKYLANYGVKTHPEAVGQPYDYGSVLHYEAWDGAKSSVDVMEAKQPYSQSIMGQRAMYSFYDLKLINMVYCNKTCESYPDLDCKNGGYPDPTDCTRCKCPEGLGGDRCLGADTSQTDGGCSAPSGDIDVDSEEEQCITSRGYGSAPYEKDTCSYMFKAPPGCQVKLRFEGDFKVYGKLCQSEHPTCFHWVEVKYKHDLTRRGARFCCYTNPSTQGQIEGGYIFSEGSQMVVSFDARFPWVDTEYSPVINPKKKKVPTVCYSLGSCDVTTTVAANTTAEPTTNPQPETLLPHIATTTTSSPETTTRGSCTRDQLNRQTSLDYRCLSGYEAYTISDTCPLWPGASWTRTYDGCVLPSLY